MSEAQPAPCIVCGKEKEAARAKSLKCRACDSAPKKRQNTAHRRLTISLPVAVWDRLDLEARAAGGRIAGYTEDLIIKRDERKNK